MEKLRLLCVLSLLIVTQVSGQALWEENFADEPNGATTGVASGPLGGNWATIDPGAGNLGATSLFGFSYFEASNTGGEAVWYTDPIPVVGVTGYTVINLTVGSFSVESDDYVRCYYRVDGGPEVLFYEQMGGNETAALAFEDPVSAIVAADASVQIIVRIRNNTRIVYFLGIPIATFASVYALTDIQVTSAEILYSRRTGGWGQTSGAQGGTWSTSRTGTPDCACVPLNDVVGVIQNGHTVTLTQNQTTVGTTGSALAPGAVAVESGGSLVLNGNTLGIQGGLVRVHSGGGINPGGAAADGRVSFNENVGGAMFRVDAGGTASLQEIVLTTNAANQHFLTGGGTLSLTGNIRINANAGSLTNNMTPAVSASGLLFDGDNSYFVNNGQVNFTVDVMANNTDDDGNVIQNNPSATLNFRNMDANDGFLSIVNYGTINQTGTFVDIQNSANEANDVNNLAGGVWNYAGTGHDTHLRLYADYSSSSFNYTRTGAQNIITPLDGYHHLSLQNSGEKTALGNFSVSGNWEQSGSATFGYSAYTVTLNGSGPQYVTIPAGTTFNSLTINNSSNGATQVSFSNHVTVRNTLSMVDGNVDLNGSTLTLGTGPATAENGTLSYGSGWLYNGSFTRYISNSSITLGNIRGHFPMGGPADYRPFFLRTLSPGNGGSVTVTHTYLATSSDVSIADGASTIARRSDSYWTVSTSGVTGGGSNYEIRAGGTGFGTVSSVNDLRICRASLPAGGSNGTATGVPSSPLVRRNGLNLTDLNNTFYIGAVNSALPIVLAYYRAEVEEDHVVSTWKTAQEINNHYFTVQKTTDFETFVDVGVIEGRGTTHEAHTYTFIDKSPFIGRSYYRLKQTDFDGQFSYSAPVMINFEGPAFPVVHVYPNPSDGQRIQISLTGDNAETDVPFEVYTQQGVLVYQGLIDREGPGVAHAAIEFSQALQPGIYILKVGPPRQLARKLVVQ